MEIQTWVDFMEVLIDLICSWVGSTTYSFTEILKQEDMGTNLQRTSEKELLNKEYIWEPICIEIEKKILEQIKDGYPFVENLRKSLIINQINGCNTQVVNRIKQNQLLEKRLPIIEFIETSLPIKLTILITYFLEFLNFHKK